MPNITFLKCACQYTCVMLNNFSLHLRIKQNRQAEKNEIWTYHAIGISHARGFPTL